MIAYFYSFYGYKVEPQDIVKVALIVIVASLTSVAIWYMMKKWPSFFASMRGYFYGAKNSSQELLSLAQDRERKAREKSSLKEAVKDIEREVKDIRKIIEGKRGDIKRLDDSLVSTEKENSSLRDLFRKLADEKVRLEKEVQDLELCSKLPLRATVAGKPGEEFFVRFKVDGEALKPSYQEVVRSVKAFEVPRDIPKITDEKIDWAFSAYKRGVVIKLDSQLAETLSEKLYFVGDIHGDVDALGRALEFAFRSHADAKVVFLGDLFDRGEKSLEASRLLIWAAKTFPGQILWLCGNHDVGLRYDETSEVFVSDVEPSEFKDYLNANPEFKDEGRALVNVIKQLPVACVIGNVWASHGGVPHNDVSGSFTSFERMSKEMIDDCVWSRMKDVPAKLPNRSHRGAEVGFKDALQFFEALKKVTGIAIKHIVCAHQHEHTGDVGYLQFKRYYKPETLSCQCIFTFQDKVCGTEPCVLIYKGASNPPTPHTI